MTKIIHTTKQLTSCWSARQVSILLTIIALALLSYSILQAKLDIGFYGLIHSFPITFFMALGILTIATAILWVSKENHQKLLLLQLLFLILALWLVPLLIGTRPYFQDAYRNLWVINSVAEQGRVYSGGYLSWPGAFLLFSVMAKVGPMNLDPIINISSFFMQLLYLLPLYVFLRNILGEARINYCWAGLWIFSLASWIPEGYFSPQGVAYFLLLVLLALITVPSFWGRSPKSLVLSSLAIVTFAALVITHLLTSLAALCILAVLCIVKRGKRVAPAIVICLLLVISWDLTGGGSILNELTTVPVITTSMSPPSEITPPPSEITPPPSEITPPPSEITPGILTLDPAFIVESQVTGQLSGSESHIAVCKLRILFSAIVTALALAGTIFLLVRRKFGIAIPLIAIALAPFLLFPLSGLHYTDVLVTRIYFYLLPAMACSAINLFDIRKRATVPILCIILIVAIPLTMVAQYGNQAIDYWSPSYTAGQHYVDEVKADSHYIFAKLSQLTWRDDKAVFDDDFLKEEHYFAISQRDDAIYDFLYNQPQFVDSVRTLLGNSNDYNRIYVNPEFGLYFSDVKE